MLNSVNLLGRLAQDPELRSTTGGTSVTSFDLAVPTLSKDREAPPDYIPIVCWGQTAEFACRYLGKGRQIVVEGRVSTRKWTDADGKNRKAVEVTASRLHFADSNKADSGYSQQQNDGELPVLGNGGNALMGDDSDLPF